MMWLWGILAAVVVISVVDFVILLKITSMLKKYEEEDNEHVDGGESDSIHKNNTRGDWPYPLL